MSSTRASSAILGVALAWLAAAQSTALAAAQTYYVAAGHTAPGGDGSSGNPFWSIQQAINAAAANNPAGGYHTIYVAAGTYDVGQEESFMTNAPYAQGGGSDHLTGLGPTNGVNMSSNLITVNSIAINGNTYLNGLRLIGAGRDTCIIDAERAADAGRTLYVRNDAVQISGFTLKGGKLSVPGIPNHAGAAMLVHGSFCVFENLLVADTYTKENYVKHVIATAYTSSSGGSSPLSGSNNIYRNIEITGCRDVGKRGSGYDSYIMAFPGSHRNLIANINIHHNFWDDDDLTGVSFLGAYSNVVFGCLLHADRGKGAAWDGAKETYVVNSTVAGHTYEGIHMQDIGSQLRANYAMNCVLADNYAGIYCANTSGQGLFLKRNLIDHPGFVFTNHVYDGYSTNSADNGSNMTGLDARVVNAPTLIDSASATGTTTRIYVSNNALYAVNDVMEVMFDRTNRTVTAKGTDGTGQYIVFTPALGYTPLPATYLENWGPGKTVSVRDYSLRLDSPCIDAGSNLVDAVTYKYVEVNGNGSYDQRVDVIVELKGYSPTTNDWVVTTDMAGNARVNGLGIDLGCYERPASGLVIVLR